MKRILMVDDVATNLICAAQVLRTSYEVSTAKSGRQALLMVKEEIPDLVMLDINMPGMDGFELLEKIREIPNAENIPVVFLTAESDKDKEIRGLEMGAMDFIKKPFEPEVMKTRIDKILALCEENNELKGAASRDVLTNLTTRNVFEKFVEAKDNSRKGYFLLIDLDNFKHVNDNYGHVVGDSVLIRLARVFEDVIQNKEGICRLGGDEFAIFIPDISDKEDIKNICRRLIASSEFEISDVLSDYSEFRVSISIGIAFKNEGDNFQSLYTNSDKALYYVKQNGKRGYHFFDSLNHKPEDFEEENTRIDLLQLKRLISENDEKDGAYTVEYEGFKRIYRFVARCMDRKNQDVQIVLFTLTRKDGKMLEVNNEFMERLSRQVTGSLRRGDVATACGESQYVVILMDANDSNGLKVADRIVEKYTNNTENDAVKLVYEMQTVKKVVST